MLENRLSCSFNFTLSLRRAVALDTPVAQAASLCFLGYYRLAAHKQDRDFNTTMLCKHWYQSSEEQVDDVNQIYRADNSKLPPSRFRMQYILLADGTCDWYYLSPDDDHEFKPGRWKVLYKDPLTLEIIKGLAVEEYKVVELTDDVLRLTLISSTELPK